MIAEPSNGYGIFKMPKIKPALRPEERRDYLMAQMTGALLECLEQPLDTALADRIRVLLNVTQRVAVEAA